jgi:hypothetical protein
VQANLQTFVLVTRSVGVEAKAGMSVTPMGYESLKASYAWTDRYALGRGEDLTPGGFTPRANGDSRLIFGISDEPRSRM